VSKVKDYKIVWDKSQHQEFEEFLAKYDYGAYDVEATGVNVRKDKIIGLAFCGEPGVAMYYPLYYYNSKTGCLEAMQENLDKVKHFLEVIQKKDLLMWNGSYDGRITKNDLKVDLVNSILAEGQLLKHTLDEDSPSFALKETAIELQDKIGLDEQDVANQEQEELKESILKNGGSYIKTDKDFWKADTEVLGIYGCADVDLTLRICEYYNGKLEEEDLIDFFYDEEVMPLYREVTVPMEDHGVKIDMELILKTKQEVQKDMDRISESVLTQLQENVDAQRWYYERVMKCCEAKNSGNFAQKYVEYFNLDMPMSEKTGKYSITKKTKEALDSPYREFLLDGEFSHSKDDEFEIKELVYFSKLKEGEEPVNIFSKPQMAEIVFDYMNIKPLSRTKKGNPQFNEDMVNWLAEEGIAWAKPLRTFNKLNKIMGTYLDRFIDAQENGFYYFSYKQWGTISGRYGSDAQQLPRPMEDGQDEDIIVKYVNRIRAFFIAEEERVFIDSDYESLEPHVFAHVSGDDGLKDIFRNGHDFYSSIAIPAEGLYEYSPDKKADNYLGKMDKQKRQNAKEYALGVPYGMTDYALGMTLAIPTDEAQDIINGYLGRFKNLKLWMDRSKYKAVTEGYVQSEVGRVRHLGRVKEIYSIYKDSLLNWKVRKKLLKTMEKEEILALYRDYKNGVNNARNFQIHRWQDQLLIELQLQLPESLKEGA
jgi:DNA polymerase I-like protein with 3'-5' exonuclease and polymerase domains